ncbi:hypothetical protein KH017_09685 [bacterium]|nr:hypothetical protein [bacterium]
MKTVCPHCHQKYDVPDDCLQQDVTCQKCEKDFTVTKAKFCPACGAANPQQAFKCGKCGEDFPSEIVNNLPPASNDSIISESEVLNSVNNWHKRELKALGLIYMFLYPVIVLMAIVFSGNYAIGAIGIVCIAVNYQAGVMMRQCVKPDLILRWTWFEKTIVILFAVINLISIPVSLWNTITNDTTLISKVVVIGIMIYICHCIYIGINIYKARLAEQAEWGVQ